MIKEKYIDNKTAYNGLSAITGISVYIVVLRSTQEQRDDSAVKSTGFSCRGPKFGFHTLVVQLLLRLQPTMLNSSSGESDVLLWTSSVLHACGTQLPAEKALYT